MKLLRFFIRFARAERGRFIAVALLGLLTGAVSASLMALINERLAAEKPVSWALGAYCGLVAFSFVAALVSRRLSIELAQNTSFGLRLRLARQILEAPLRKIEEAGNERLFASLTEDVGQVTGALMQVPQLCFNTAILSGCLVYLAYLSVPVFVGLVIFLVLAVLTYVLPERIAVRRFREAREEWDRLVGHFRALTHGNKELKLHAGRQAAFFDDQLSDAADAFRGKNVAGSTVYAVIGSWSQVLYFIVIGLLLFLVPTLESMSREVLTGYALTILFMGGPLTNLLNLIPGFGRAGVSLDKVETLGLSLENATTEATGDAGAALPWRRIELAGVAHTYHRENEEGSFTLGPMDLAFRPGELVFIVGGNGSGKTTLAKLLTGLYTPEEGELRLDGQVVDDALRPAYRQLFAVVFSDFFLFDDLLGLAAAGEAGEDATPAPSLDERAAGYLATLQLDRKVTVEGGHLSTLDLSQGQRKRLALLTAYLEDRPIYLFDEWAADQDPHFKSIFYRQLLPELRARGKTVLVISHDDRYYDVADRIVKLEYGQLVLDREVGAGGEEAAAVASSALAGPVGGGVQG